MTCNDKHPGCHSKRNHYKMVKLFLDKKREKKHKEYDFYEFLLESKKKIIKINQRNKRIYR